MKVKVFEDLDSLNRYLENRQPNEVEIKFQSEVVGQTNDKKTRKTTFEIVDRFLVITKD